LGLDASRSLRPKLCGVPPVTPWALSPLGDVVLVKPEHWLFKPGDWDGVEHLLGTRLPRDYKDVIGDGLACIFGEELVIASPFDPNPNLNLVRVAAQSAWGLAYLRHHDPNEYDGPIYSDSGGLLGWGNDGGGGVYHWVTDGSNPDGWVVAVSGRPVFDPPLRRTTLNLSGYIEALRSGAVNAMALADWPPGDARIVRRH
jgi:hypothetical protein